jgi:hypothetical protein
VWQIRTYAQPKCEPHQHQGWIGCRNAQDHVALGLRPHSAQLLPPAAAATAATSAHCLIPTWRRSLAATNPSRAVWRNATGQQHLPPADTMAMLVYQPGQGMMMNVRQYPPNASNVPMMQMGQQPLMATMMMNHYAPNQQPNQQPGTFDEMGG